MSDEGSTALKLRGSTALSQNYGLQPVSSFLLPSLFCYLHPHKEIHPFLYHVGMDSNTRSSMYNLNTVLTVSSFVLNIYHMCFPKN